MSAIAIPLHAAVSARLAAVAPVRTMRCGRDATAAGAGARVRCCCCGGGDNSD